MPQNQLYKKWPVCDPYRIMSASTGSQIGSYTRTANYPVNGAYSPKVNNPGSLQMGRFINTKLAYVTHVNIIANEVDGNWAANPNQIIHLYNVNKWVTPIDDFDIEDHITIPFDDLVSSKSGQTTCSFNGHGAHYFPGDWRGVLIQCDGAMNAIIRIHFWGYRK